MACGPGGGDTVKDFKGHTHTHGFPEGAEGWVSNHGRSRAEKRAEFHTSATVGTLWSFQTLESSMGRKPTRKQWRVVLLLVPVQVASPQALHSSLHSHRTGRRQAPRGSSVTQGPGGAEPAPKPTGKRVEPGDEEAGRGPSRPWAQGSTPFHGKPKLREALRPVQSQARTTRTPLTWLLPASPVFWGC